ncbi:MAG: hypothetical protein H0X38_02480 [Planctomycetes bacterium]|nr:hypothetical protein [Planctomycetota bacterium]
MIKVDKFRALLKETYWNKHRADTLALMETHDLDAEGVPRNGIVRPIGRRFNAREMARAHFMGAAQNLLEIDELTDQIVNGKVDKKLIATYCKALAESGASYCESMIRAGQWGDVSAVYFMGVDTMEARKLGGRATAGGESLDEIDKTHRLWMNEFYRIRTLHKSPRAACVKIAESIPEVTNIRTGKKIFRGWRTVWNFLKKEGHFKGAEEDLELGRGFRPLTEPNTGRGIGRVKDVLRTQHRVKR